MTKKPDPILAGIYCRMSLAAMGDTTKVEDQERISRNLGTQLQWEIAEGVGYPEPNGVYTDNNRSAWNRRVKRPGWNAMLADVDAGKINAVIVYHGDRLVRQPRDLEKLIDLGEHKGIRLASPTGTRNLGHTEDRVMLRVIAAFAEAESSRTSERRKSQTERWRLKGRINTGGRGGRLFGFDSAGLIQVAHEATIVREVFDRFLEGEAVRHIAASLRDRGITTTTGKAMHPIAIRRMIASPRYAGLMLDGVSAAAWEPVVTREDWETANAILNGRAGLLMPNHNARRYLLSGIARCGVCGGPMQVLPAYTKSTGEKIAARYGCLAPGCRKVFRKLEHLDAYITARAVAKLNDKRNPPGRVPSTPGLAAELRALAEERQAIEAAITDHTKGRLHLLLGRLDSVDARLAQIRELTAASAAARVTGAHAGITEDEFAALPLSVRRTLVAALFTVTVLPASKRGPGFNTDDVQLTPPHRS